MFGKCPKRTVVFSWAPTNGVQQRNIPMIAVVIIFIFFSILRARSKTGKTIGVVTTGGASMMQVVFHGERRAGGACSKRRFFHKPHRRDASRWAFRNH